MREIERFRVLCRPRHIERQPLDDAVEPPEGEPQARQRKHVDLRKAAIAPRLAVDQHEGVALVILRIDLEPDLAGEREHAVLLLAEPCAPDRHDGAVVGRPVPDAAADAIPRLDQRDRLSALLQAFRGREAGEPRTDDDVIRA